MKESDWKLFQTLKPTLLNRLCERALQECVQAMADETLSTHERFLKVFYLINERNEDVAVCFDDPRRSNLFIKLVELKVRDLLEPDELARFSEEAQALLNPRSGQ